jgi:hypothetical protein
MLREEEDLPQLKNISIEEVKSLIQFVQEKSNGGE